jgi:hypothetical protein
LKTKSRLTPCRRLSLEEVMDIYQEGILNEWMNVGERHFADTAIDWTKFLPLIKRSMFEI